MDFTIVAKCQSSISISHSCLASIRHMMLARFKVVGTLKASALTFKAVSVDQHQASKDLVVQEDHHQDLNDLVVHCTQIACQVPVLTITREIRRLSKQLALIQ